MAVDGSGAGSSMDGVRGSFLTKRYLVAGSLCAVSLLFLVAFMWGTGWSFSPVPQAGVV